MFTQKFAYLGSMALIFYLQINMIPICCSKEVSNLKTVEAKSLTEKQVKNGTYTLEGDIAKLKDGSCTEKIKLTKEQLKGCAPGEIPCWTADIENIALGELNRDGKGDAAIVISYWGGGTGRFKYLIAVENVNGKPIQKAIYDLGDRVIAKDIKINSDGIITLQMMLHGPNEGLATASLPAKWQFKLRGGKLEKTSK
jgi:hypothetical protein